MSKLAHSNQDTMDEIERKHREVEDRGERFDPPFFECPDCGADLSDGVHKIGCRNGTNAG
jgi:hypothetical protein